MKPEEFFKRLDDTIAEYKDTFTRNMHNNGIDEMDTFCEWIDYFARWMEWLDEEMCDQAYPYIPTLEDIERMINEESTTDKT